MNVACVSREIRALSLLKHHPNIMKFHGFYFNHDAVVLVTEFIELSLSEWFEKDDLSDLERRRCLYDIAKVFLSSPLPSLFLQLL